jgi:hypothetical protein
MIGLVLAFLDGMVGDRAFPLLLYYPALKRLISYGHRYPVVSSLQRVLHDDLRRCFE